MKNVLLPALLWLVALLPALAQTDGAPQVRPVPTFRAIKVSNSIELVLTAGHEQHVEVSALTKEYRDRILTTVAGGVLTVRYDSPLEKESRAEQRINKKLRVAITADQLTAITASSSAAVSASGSYAAPDFQLDLSSSAAFKGDMAVNVLVVRQSSSSVVTLAGSAARFDLRTSSSAVFDGERLQTDHAQVEASSSSLARVAVKEDLLADASSSASIRYSGSPTLTKHVSSSGSVSGH